MAARRALLVSSMQRFSRPVGCHRFFWKRRISSDIGEGNNVRLFDKVLVANRGEIACRVMHTARKLGIRTVTVYSEADKHSMHVTMADEAYCIGPPPSGESYLKQEKIMDVAKDTGAQAIHPGYGFLSENKDFAELCQKEGVEFIGPPASAIEKMGIKRVSKQIMSESSVPVVPGYFGEDQSDDRLTTEAEKLGFPLMIKADLGGGGKGMRIVSEKSEFQSALRACRGEAKMAFNDDKVLLEKFMKRPRHVEVQVFGDKHGNMLHLFERDCSVQRRHQKIIEEAPAPGLRPEVREQILATAVRTAKAVGYVGAGTVEFIMEEDQHFYFMEMNTRLQVEHPVTEMITGIDLVDWQFRVAAGARLPIDQSDLNLRGHAFEARIYAENPTGPKDFSPSPGLLHHLVIPRTSNVVRVDTGVKQGDAVTEHYDPMIAKLVVWGEDRASALKRLQESLKHYQIAGVNTNVEFLGRVASHTSFEMGDVHTVFIEQHQSDLFPPPSTLSEPAMAEATLAVLALEEWRNARSQAYDHDPFSPFSGCSGRTLNTHTERTLSFESQGNSFDVDVRYHGDGDYRLNTGCSKTPQWLQASGKLSEEDGTLVLRGFIEDRQVHANVAVVEDTIHIFTVDGGYTVELSKPSFIKDREKAVSGETRSPKYPATVKEVHVKPGDVVTEGTVLMTVVGMKMETNIVAAKDGKVKYVFFQETDSVPKFSKVIEFEETDE